MALSVGDREVRALTAAEVLRMVELGILSEDERVELWVLDVPMRRLLVFADPRGDAYTTRTTISGDEAVRPSHVEVAPLDLAELLARL